ncbi:hypothetical protein BKA70DRAFT_1239198 [Coprinopsis sp. MPI-PUGE-AT-0042]|nr:hypothetical protein BKA70DRAFT_1239198 [Coprinopsis sp. MPI-PUGE-AT-0042]
MTPYASPSSAFREVSSSPPLHVHPPLLSPLIIHPGTGPADPHHMLASPPPFSAEERYSQLLQRSISDVLRLEASVTHAETLLASETIRYAQNMKRRQMKLKALGKSASLMAMAYRELSEIMMLDEDN